MAEYTKWEVRTYTSSVFGNQAALTCKEVWMGERRIASTINEDNADLICALRNAAIKINPENPLAVAEGIKGLREALGTIRRTTEGAGGGYEPTLVIETVYRIANEALASIERDK